MRFLPLAQTLPASLAHVCYSLAVQWAMGSRETGSVNLSPDCFSSAVYTHILSVSWGLRQAEHNSILTYCSVSR